MIANAQDDKALPVYGDGMHERDWLYVEDYCRAIDVVLEKGHTGSVYNVSAATPQDNLSIIRTILARLGKPESLTTFVPDRPGHDRRYSLDSAKLRQELGWRPEISFEEGIRRTVAWYATNRTWLENARSGEYLKYYERHYLRREETLNRH